MASKLLRELYHYLILSFIVASTSTATYWVSNSWGLLNYIPSHKILGTMGLLGLFWIFNLILIVIADLILRKVLRV